MDLLTSTVTASADTLVFRTAATRPENADDVQDLATADYVHPFPTPSDYLDTAVAPMPWPTRTMPRQPEGGRPTLPYERRLTGKPHGRRAYPRQRPSALAQCCDRERRLAGSQ